MRPYAIHDGICGTEYGSPVGWSTRGVAEWHPDRWNLMVWHPSGEVGTMMFVYVMRGFLGIIRERLKER